MPTEHARILNKVMLQVTNTSKHHSYFQSSERIPIRAYPSKLFIRLRSLLSPVDHLTGLRRRIQYYMLFETKFAHFWDDTPALPAANEGRMWL